MEKNSNRDNPKKSKCIVCGSNAMKNSQYCYFHNKAIPLEVRKKNSSKGGKRKTSLIPISNYKIEDVKSFKKFKLESISDITNFMRGIITLCGNGIINGKEAKTYFQLSEKLINAIMTEKKYKHII